ncbi:LpqB family beta-propeller domain-containing protein [Rarobacter incanus]|uniref:Sporulation and spore germination protein n=1 Tax=Rarobacter incanus TaxID=153494 RepID=A0A542SNQ9_9MICO|nr:LpqB family beta-propeller domain-containing protein [Rarobacter incanus]TQK76198.1 sporulation and spore germination protein [Rarobacter incanus]
MMARRTLCGLLAVLAALALAGCASIPTSGSVMSASLPATGNETVYIEADGPTQDASPLDIARGFIRAQAVGVYDDYRVAKEFLTSARAQSWDPGTETIVYTGEPAFSALGPDGTPADTTASGAAAEYVDVSGPIALAARVDSTGQFAEESADAEQVVSMRMVREDGQWRISTSPEGTLISMPNFTSTHRRVALQFLSPDRTYLVPDVRWYPVKNLAGYVAEGLLAGPAQWLQDAVATAIPPKTALNVAGSVQIDADGQVAIDLDQTILALDATARAEMMAQFAETLYQVPQVRSVRIMSGATDLTVSPATLMRDPTAGVSVSLVKDGRLGSIRDGGFHADDAFGAITVGKVTGLAVEAADGVQRGRTAIVRVGAGALYQIRAAGVAAGATPLLKAKTVSNPSIDRHGWVWTAANGKIVAISQAGTVRPAARWLEGRSVLAVRVSRDGARVAIVSRSAQDSAEASRVDIAAVVRDDGGAPSQLVQGIVAGGGIAGAEDVTWIGEATVAVLSDGAASSDATVFEAPLGDANQAQPAVGQAKALAGDWDIRSLYVLRTDGVLMSRSATGASWRQAATGIAAVAYPG